MRVVELKGTITTAGYIKLSEQTMEMLGLTDGDSVILSYLENEDDNQNERVDEFILEYEEEVEETDDED